MHHQFFPVGDRSVSSDAELKKLLLVREALLVKDDSTVNANVEPAYRILLGMDIVYDFACMLPRSATRRAHQKHSAQSAAQRGHGGDGHHQPRRQDSTRQPLPFHTYRASERQPSTAALHEG